jgi:hypothetical protein
MKRGGKRAPLPTFDPRVLSRASAAASQSLTAASGQAIEPRQTATTALPTPDVRTFTAPEAIGIGHATSAFPGCGHAAGLALGCNGSMLSKKGSTEASNTDSC